MYIEDFHYFIFFLKIPKEIHTSSTITVSFISQQLIVIFPKEFAFFETMGKLASL